MANRAKNPSARQGKANPVPEPATPAPNVLDVAVPPLPDTLRGLPHDQRLDAQGLWEQIWAAGHGFYVVETDSYVIERYVALQVRRAHLMEILNAEGYTAIGSQGQQVQHPAARLLLDIEGKLPALEDRLGLSPEARLRLGLAVAETKSKLDAFLED